MTVNNSSLYVVQSAMAVSLWRVAVHCDTRGHQPTLLPHGSGAPPRLEHGAYYPLPNRNFRMLPFVVECITLNRTCH